MVVKSSLSLSQNGVMIMINGKSIMYGMQYHPQLLGVLDSIDQLPKEATDGDIYIVNEQTKINVNGDMINATISTTYIRSSDVWLEYQKEIFCEEENEMGDKNESSYQKRKDHVAMQHVSFQKLS